MFTGIIETTGIITHIATNGSNKTFEVESSISNELKIDQSVSHNGVCLTVEKTTGNQHSLTAIEETLAKTNLDQWTIGSVVNLERCITLSGRLDGHIVQGHVDTTATCTEIIEKDGSKEFNFQFDKKFAALIIEKGSIAINGISLTVFNVGDNSFTVAIIPYTLEHTNMKYLEKGDVVNIEFDMIGKYVNRLAALKK
jgi:riboflavin synthase